MTENSHLEDWSVSGGGGGGLRWGGDGLLHDGAMECDANVRADPRAHPYLPNGL